MTPVLTEDDENSVAVLSNLGELDSHDPMFSTMDSGDAMDHMNRVDPPRRHNPPPIMVPPRYTNSVKVEPEEQAPRDNQSRVLPRLLRMADTYRESGSVRQAIEMYFELIDQYSETPQALTAEDRLLDVAQSFELAGELRQARGIYERLL
jgi:hypothetical protein